MTRHVIVSVLILALSALACGEFVVTPTPQATPPPSASPSPIPTLTATPRATEAEADNGTAIVRQYSVNVHIEPDVKSEVTGYVYADDVVTILECQPDGDYCKIEHPFGWVYRGCLAGFEDGRGCEAVK
jgi:hypothetical protein